MVFFGSGGVNSARLFSQLALLTQRFPNDDSQHRIGTLDLIQRQGYPAETHFVTTDDGYILGVHRIPPSALGSPVVLYLHGYEAASSDIVMRERDSSLGFLLADRGYDVWMINFRGNRYSRNHTSLNASENAGEFWRFTWWEMGERDIPAVMDHILAVTRHQRLQILGHGQGLTCLYVMLHTKPAYSSLIALVSAMSPIAYTSHTRGMLALVTDLVVSLPEFMTEIAFLTPSSGLDLLTAKWCSEQSKTQDLCYNILFTVTGFDLAQQNRSTLVTQLQHFPSGTSARTIVHTGQNIKQAKFQAYDWGPQRNMEKYNSPEPPQVDLKRATPPHALYLAPGNDFVCQPGDYERLIKELPNIVTTFTVGWDMWNHMDFITAVDAPRLLYPYILEEMDKF